MGMLGLALVYVGFVLFINALLLLGKLNGKHVAPMNVFTGILIFAGVMRTVAWQGDGIVPYFYAMQSLLFGFTYLWVAINSIWDVEGDGLGWYCLLVAVVAVPTMFTAFPDMGLVILWAMWASLWFLFFLLLGLHMAIAKVTAYWTLINAVVTGAAGYVILIQKWPWL
ncbi:MAG: AmiS/UreI family transporter [Deferrisomatales bacterium]